MTSSPLVTDILAAQSHSASPLIIILLGPPGAGKGTQATMLSKTLGISHISTGNLLRTHIQTATPFGKEASMFMDQGKLVPDPLILDMLFARVAEKDCAHGYLLDGFPRTLSQAENYHKRLSLPVQPIVINLEIADHTIIERLGHRWTCKVCHAPFHAKYSPPKVPNQCDHCQGELFQRSDDTPEIIQNRLTVYHTQTAPLVSYYEQQHVLKSISCEDSIDHVLENILHYIHAVYVQRDASL